MLDRVNPIENCLTDGWEGVGMGERNIRQTAEDGWSAATRPSVWLFHTPSSVFGRKRAFPEGLALTANGSALLLLVGSPPQATKHAGARTRAALAHPILFHII